MTCAYCNGSKFIYLPKKLRVEDLMSEPKDCLVEDINKTKMFPCPECSSIDKRNSEILNVQVVVNKLITEQLTIDEYERYKRTSVARALSDELCRGDITSVETKETDDEIILNYKLIVVKDKATKEDLEAYWDHIKNMIIDETMATLQSNILVRRLNQSLSEKEFLQKMADYIQTQRHSDNFKQSVKFGLELKF